VIQGEHATQFPIDVFKPVQVLAPI